MSYIQLSSTRYFDGGYSVTAIRKEDIFLIKEWRNAQMDILRQVSLLTDEQQLSYYNNVILGSFSNSDTRLMLFSLLYNDKLIGYGGLTNIHWSDKRVELSFLTDPHRAADPKIYTSDFNHFIKLMKRITFEELELNRIFTETYDIRPVHIGILEQNGFKFEGRMREHIRIGDNFTDSLIHGLIKADYEY